MKRLTSIFTIVLFILGGTNCLAQFMISADTGLKLPTGARYKNILDNGYGFSLSGEYKIPVLPAAVEVTAGYDSWPYKNIILYSESNSGVHTTSFSGIDMYSFFVSAGPVLYLSIPGSPFSPYAGFEAGVMAATSNATGASYGSGIVYTPFAGVRYSFTPGLVSLDLNAKDSSFKQNGSDTFTYFEVDAGVVINL